MVWINNFSLSRVGYQVLTPCYDYGFRYVQECLPAKKIFLTKYFSLAKGVDAPGNYFDEKEINTFIDYLVDLILKNPEEVEKLHQKTYQLNSQFIEFAKKQLHKDFSSISNEGLGKIYSELIHQLELAHLTAASTTWFVDSEEQKLSKLLIDKVKDRVKDKEAVKDAVKASGVSENALQSDTIKNSAADTKENNSNKLDPAYVFSILTTLPKNTFILEEELSSLLILEKISHDKISTDIILNLKDFTKVPKELPEDLKSAILSHYEQWRWTPFDYLGPAYNLDYYLTIWQGLLKQEMNIKEEIQKIIERPKKIEQKRQRVMERLNLSPDDKRLFNIAADIAYLKGYRKDATFFGYYVLSFIYKEMAKRLHFSLNQIHLLSYQEIKDYFLTRKEINLSEVNERQKTTIILHEEGKEVKIMTGKKAEDFLTEQKPFIKKVVIDTSVSELKGTTACSGKARGIVRIINHTEDMKKMEQGNIMVSPTTFPSLVPAMKKASAIITEDGGITCHAAIVSREMNIPCITGIKTATKVLKEGYLIEVDAGTGIVKIIERK